MCVYYINICIFIVILSLMYWECIVWVWKCLLNDIELSSFVILYFVLIFGDFVFLKEKL